MKKLLTALTLSALLVASASITAFAASSAPYAVCMVEGCNMAGTHQHDGKAYGGHAMGDGHNYHQVCSAANCTQADTHDHDGTTYFGHHNGDGHTYHNGTEQYNNPGGHNRHRGGCHR